MWGVENVRFLRASWECDGEFRAIIVALIGINTVTVPMMLVGTSTKDILDLIKITSRRLEIDSTGPISLMVL